MKYSIKWNNTRRFHGAFYATECIECSQPIEEGDPIGKLETEEGYLCQECISDIGDDGYVHTTNKTD